MQRLSRDGWLDIQQGKPTRIRDYLKDGNLNILAGLLKADPDLLEMWQLLAPQYTASATRRAPGLIIDLLKSFDRLPDEAEPYAQSMWKLHQILIAYCDNLVYGLIFNTFKEFYHQLAIYYYTTPEHRQNARKLWETLIPSIKALDIENTSQQVFKYVSTTAEFWKNITFEQYRTEVFDDPRQLEEKKKKKKKTKK